VREGCDVKNLHINGDCIVNCNVPLFDMPMMIDNLLSSIVLSILEVANEAQIYTVD
jgi:hypothetical protein